MGSLMFDHFDVDLELALLEAQILDGADAAGLLDGAADAPISEPLTAFEARTEATELVNFLEGTTTENTLFDDFFDAQNGAIDKQGLVITQTEPIPTPDVAVPIPTPPGGNPYVGYGSLIGSDYDIFDTYGDFDEKGLVAGDDEGDSEGDDIINHVDLIGYSCEHTAIIQANAIISITDRFDGFDGDHQPEYGVVIVTASDGSFVLGPLVTGQSYHDSNPPGTSLSPPSGYSWSDVTATIHSHPDSGNSDIDIRNRAPSDGDWLAADQMVQRGANPAELTLYIVDNTGVIRAFDYKSPAERHATTRNPSGNMNSASDGEIVSSVTPNCANNPTITL